MGSFSSLWVMCWSGPRPFWMSSWQQIQGRLRILRSLGLHSYGILLWLIVFKLNIDASLAVSAGLVCLGLVIQDNLGQVKAAGSMKLLAFFLPLLAEAATVLYGVWLALRSGLSPILVESDTLGVVNVIKGGSIPCSNLGLFVSDIFSVCRSLNILGFSFAPRTVNKVDDVLAKVALSVVSDCFWSETRPPLVELLV
ncbi:hypothetical protein ACOSQ3_013689 [Xanthoceras sorbifolium]